MFITVEKDVHIFVQDVNPGPGSKTVFFVHGWPLNHQMYQYQLNVLPEHGFRCIAMDIRGNGQSDKPWTGYTYDQLADDIAIVLEALQVENATLVGFSVGGALSIRYMSRYNGRHISKLALIDAVSPSFVKNQESPYGVPKEQADALINQMYANLPKFLNDVSLSFFNRNLGAATLEWFSYLGMQSASYALIKILQAAANEDVTKDLNKINVPTKIFHGVHDQLIPYKSAELTQQRIKNSQLHALTNSGHGSPIDQADELNKELIKFLQT
ncbi:alpha/beta hydrolase [Bacillus thuringiensis]|uniref:alpha/beta fold hydrolase n=1 Tax=Bacillus thuringiensis TaxID=1428 RepID=UPI000BEDE72B|nr:alpha/beta hydrolase [Bacillus thuringiensis]PEC72251.1 alpha/beta hydrolase [Bacillus thuringiensis]PEF88676.1 alpha/beta hydrolase [Bacillus thuringiensis]PES59968.1 alpha/beta hydrolase [Bacillus thuringiensis]PFS64308.1 alpha/beta hydrolase [Bacillus thuringiensis]PGL62458.1 alpha/beta hydrolase [Bacillus thuringiensis]